MSSVMFQGTASNVGKSLIVAGICRVLTQDGYDVVPFKPQNMSLNSYIDIDGKEMGRAQVFQAVASGKEPRAYMNPILLKPCGNHISQVIFCGDVVCNMESKKYQEYKKKLIKPLTELFNDIESNHDIVVIEGAGSPAEININSLDISNMKMAEIANSPVILVADIDRGGVFASIVGTLMLLKEEYRKKVRAVIINKFRGKKEYFSEGVKMLEDIIKIPVLGVIPYFDVSIDEEDGVSDIFKIDKSIYRTDSINITVIKYSHMSNYTDFEVFNHIEGVNLTYLDLRRVKGLKSINIQSDIIILPGSKNTIEDLNELKQSCIFDYIKNHVNHGKTLIGICGGYQMMGNEIIDIFGIDSGENKKNISKGFGFFNKKTIFENKKITNQVKFKFETEEGVFNNLKDFDIEGYELHLGRDEYSHNIENEKKYQVKGNILGTYVHGFFDNIQFTTNLLNNIRKSKGLDEVYIPEKTYDELKMMEYDKIADVMRENLDIELLYKIIFKGI